MNRYCYLSIRRDLWLFLKYLQPGFIVLKICIHHCCYLSIRGDLSLILNHLHHGYI